VTLKTFKKPQTINKTRKMQHILQLMHETKPFEALESNGVKKALQKCKDADHRALLAPEIAIKRILAPKQDPIWQQWRTAASLKVEGHVEGEPTVIYDHTGNYFSDPGNIPPSNELIDGAAEFPQDRLEELARLADNQTNNRTIFKFQGEQYEQLKESPSGVISVEKAREHPQTAPFLGGEGHVEPYLDRHTRVYGIDRIGIWHRDDLPENPEALPRARPLFFSSYFNDGLDASLSFGSLGGFEGVNAGAEGTAAALAYEARIKELEGQLEEATDETAEIVGSLSRIQRKLDIGKA